MSFLFQLVREDEGLPPMVVFEDSSTSGLVPLWEEAGVYEALYNSDGKRAREVSRAISYGLDRIREDASLAHLLPPGVSQGEAIRFLENINRACVTHGAAWIQTR